MEYTPRYELLNVSPEQRTEFELTPRGIHWDDLDEDISIQGLLAGQGDQSHSSTCSMPHASSSRPPMSDVRLHRKITLSFAA